MNVVDAPTEVEDAAAEEVMWRWQVGNQMREMGFLLRATREENKVLRQELHQLRADQTEAQFQTPEEEKKVRGSSQGLQEASQRARGEEGARGGSNEAFSQLPNPSSADPRCR